MNLYYKPSGKYSPLSVVYLVLVCATLIPAVAWLYAYAIWYCPLIYINFFITVAFGCLIGLLVHYIVIGSGKVRSPGVAIFLALAGGLWGWYLHWAFWIDLAINAEAGQGILISHTNYAQSVELLQNPLRIFQVAASINETGLWSIFKIQFSGFALVLVWLVEMAMIVILPIFFALVKVQKPFSESTGRWAKEIKLPAFQYIKKPALLKKALEENDLAKVAPFKRASDKNHHSEFVLFEAGNNEWYLSVTNKFANQDDKGKIKFSDDTFIKYLSIAQAWVADLQATTDIEPDLPTVVAQPAELTSSQEVTQYDTNKTKIIAELLEVPATERNDDWHNTFHTNIVEAAFTCGNPQIVQGPDGFPYFMLQFPESQKPFNPYSLVSIKDYILANGYGVALSPDGGQVVWSVRHGDMVNLHINGELFTHAELPELKSLEVLDKPETVLVGQPAESYLPMQTRAVLRDYLISTGVETPQVMLLHREREGIGYEELAFNTFADDFESEESFNTQLQYISWFLPRHYIVVAVPNEPHYTNDFKEL